MTFIFLCGSSSVGKTELLDKFPETFSGKRINKVNMSFQTIREQLGNPTWEEVENDKTIGIFQQSSGMDIYEKRILDNYAALSNSDEYSEDIYLYERCPLDIIGYSTAFGLPIEHIEVIKEKAEKIFQIISTTHPVIIVHRAIDNSYPYDRRNNARPSSRIRARCGDSIISQLLYYRHLSNLNVRIIDSVNNDEAEAESILRVLNG
jgi:hypothetical protein